MLGRPRIQWQVGSQCHPGARDRQEDAAASHVSPDGSMALGIVADGLGGHHAGDLASQSVVRAASGFWSDLMSGPLAPNLPLTDLLADLERRVAHAAAAVVDRVPALAAAEEPHLRTTVVCALVRGEELGILWAGDSRAYKLQAGRLTLLTRDDSVPAMLFEQGLIVADALRGHPDAGRLTRSIGPDPTKNRLHSKVQKIAPDACLLLCSDGTWQPLSDEAMISAMQTEAVDRKISQLLNAAIATAGPGADNASAVIIAPVSPRNFARLGWRRILGLSKA